MKLTVHAFATIDGVMQGPGAPDEDPSGGFASGGWVTPYVDSAEFGAVVDDWFAACDELLLGRTTYDMMYAYWSQVTDPDNPVAEKLNGRPKHVVSRSLDRVEWQHASLLTGDLGDAVRALKAREGAELQVHGSWELIQDLTRLGLVDEYRVLVFPVVLGDGKRLFADGTPPTAFEVAEARTTAQGLTSLALRPTGAPATGAFAVEDGAETATLH